MKRFWKNRAGGDSHEKLSDSHPSPIPRWYRARHLPRQEHDVEKIIQTFAETAAAVLTERCQIIDADRRSQCWSDRCDEITEVSVELNASGEGSEMWACVAIVDSPE